MGGFCIIRVTFNQGAGGFALKTQVGGHSELEGWAGGLKGREAERKPERLMVSLRGRMEEA